MIDSTFYLLIQNKFSQSLDFRVGLKKGLKYMLEGSTKEDRYKCCFDVVSLLQSVSSNRINIAMPLILV